jgi:hypothetical protein
MAVRKFFDKSDCWLASMLFKRARLLKELSISTGNQVEGKWEISGRSIVRSMDNAKTELASGPGRLRHFAYSRR